MAIMLLIHAHNLCTLAVDVVVAVVLVIVVVLVLPLAAPLAANHDDLPAIPA